MTTIISFFEAKLKRMTPEQIHAEALRLARLLEQHSLPRKEYPWANAVFRRGGELCQHPADKEVYRLARWWLQFL